MTATPTHLLLLLAAYAVIASACSTLPLSLPPGAIEPVTPPSFGIPDRFRSVERYDGAYVWVRDVRDIFEDELEAEIPGASVDVTAEEVTLPGTVRQIELVGHNNATAVAFAPAGNVTAGARTLGLTGNATTRALPIAATGNATELAGVVRAPNPHNAVHFTVNFDRDASSAAVRRAARRAARRKKWRAVLSVDVSRYQIYGSGRRYGVFVPKRGRR